MEEAAEVATLTGCVVVGKAGVASEAVVTVVALLLTMTDSTRFSSGDDEELLASLLFPSSVWEL
jgi:hypothetical protein